MIAELKMIHKKLNELERIILKDASNLKNKNNSHSEWMTVTEAAKYAGVSFNTFMKFRLMGLRISQIGGVKRVSRKEIDKFLEENSY